MQAAHHPMSAPALWTLQVPAQQMSSYPSPSGPSPVSGLGSEYSPSPASGYQSESMPPWWSQQQQQQQQAAPLALDMSGLSVGSADPSPVMAPAPATGVLTPVSPHGTATSTRKRSLAVYEGDDYEVDDGDVNVQLECPSPVEGEHLGLAAPAPVHAKPSGKAGNQNFVVKLYTMIENPQSAQFIQWSENGTSFVVSNITDFSRLILGTHFKHSNFSSFVRQLNMYGFHKMNRTPRAQRGAEDQVWEFSHARFLRGRPDLLEQIRRKASDDGAAGPAPVPAPAPAAAPEPAGDVHAALAQTQRELADMRARFAQLAGVTRALHTALRTAAPQLLPCAFPPELADDEPPALAYGAYAPPVTPPGAGAYAAGMALPALPARRASSGEASPCYAWSASPPGSAGGEPQPAKRHKFEPYPHQRPLARTRSDDRLGAAGWTGLGQPSPQPVPAELMPSIARMGREFF